MTNINTVYDLLDYKYLTLCRYEGEPVLYTEDKSSPVKDITMNKELLRRLDYIYPRRIVRKDGCIVSHHNNKLFSIRESFCLDDIKDIENIMLKMIDLTNNKRFKSLKEIMTLFEENMPDIKIQLEKVEDKFNYHASPDVYRTMWIQKKDWEDDYFKYNKSIVLFEIPYRYPCNVINKNSLHDWLISVYNDMFIGEKGE